MKALNSIAVVACLLAQVFVSSSAEPDAQPSRAEKPSSSKRIKSVGVEEFAKLVDAKTNVVMDVRSAKEFAAGHIAGAINLDVNAADFEAKAAKMDKNKTYLVHCAAGVRSAKACDKLDKLSFTRLVNLEPGFKAWEKAGKAVAK